MRISRDEWGLQIAEVTALRGTCLRRQVGCILTDENGIVLATGYNGVARGLSHCNETVMKPIYGEPEDMTRLINDPYDPKKRMKLEKWVQTKCVGHTPEHPYACLGALAESGTELNACMATHAEMNAIAQCPAIDRIHTCYTTTEPCISCTKMIMNTGCKRVVYRQDYAGSGFHIWASRSILSGKRIYEWLRVENEVST